MKHEKHAIVIDGPRRDYDFATFCCYHVNAANEFAAQWMEELIDELEPGEDATVKVSIQRWLDWQHECEACGDGPPATEHVYEPKQEKEDAPDGS